LFFIILLQKENNSKIDISQTYSCTYSWALAAEIPEENKEKLKMRSLNRRRIEIWRILELHKQLPLLDIV